MSDCSFYCYNACKYISLCLYCLFVYSFAMILFRYLRQDAIVATVSFPYQIMLLTEHGVIYRVCSACVISVAQALSIHNLLLFLSFSIHALGRGVLWRGRVYGHGVGSSRSLPLTVVLGAFGMQQAADLTHCRAGVGEGLGGWMAAPQ